MSTLWLAVVLGLVALLILAIAIGAGAAAWLARWLHQEFLSSRERIEHARNMLYFAGGLSAWMPAIFGLEGQRSAQAALLVATVALVFWASRRLTRRLEALAREEG